MGDRRDLVQAEGKSRAQLRADLRWLQRRRHAYADPLVQDLIQKIQSELFKTLPTVVGAGSRKKRKCATKKARSMMDMSRFAGSAFVKPDDVRDAPMRATIASIEISKKFDRPVLIFTNGLKFTVNQTKAQEMLKAVGPESGDWLGEVVELTHGQTEYKEEMVDTVFLKVIPREAGVEKKVPPQPKATTQRSARGDMDDEIPF